MNILRFDVSWTLLSAVRVFVCERARVRVRVRVSACGASTCACEGQLMPTIHRNIACNRSRRLSVLGRQCLLSGKRALHTSSVVLLCAGGYAKTIILKNWIKTPVVVSGCDRAAYKHTQKQQFGIYR